MSKDKKTKYLLYADHQLKKFAVNTLGILLKENFIDIGMRWLRYGVKESKDSLFFS